MTLPCANPTCLPRGADKPARALDGLLLCGHHTERIGIDALRLAILHTELGDALTGRPGGPAAHAGVTTHPGLNLDIAAAAARLDIRRLLVGTARAICYRRGVALPNTARWAYQPLPLGIEGPLMAVRVRLLNERNEALAAMVRDNRTWLAGHPDAGTISDEYGYLRRRANGILYGERTRIVHIGRCPMMVLAGLPCRGEVRALVRPTDELLPLAVSCEDPEHSWPVELLARLGRVIGLKEGRWMSAAELAILYGLPIRRIHQLASLHQWQRTNDRIRPVLYSAHDARRTPTLVAIIDARATPAESEMTAA